MKRIKALWTADKNLSSLIVIFLIVFMFCGIMKGGQFININTFQTMGKLLPEYGIMALGMALALLIGGIDLSVVYTSNLCAIVLSNFLVANLAQEASVIAALPTLLLGFLIVIVIGAACGAVNGLLVAGIGIPPILATLGTQSLFLGVSLVITGGKTVSKLPPQLSDLLGEYVLGIPATALIFIVISILLSIVVAKTVFGRRIRMLGTNPIATTYSGLSNLALTVRTFMIIGVLAAIAGIIMTARLNSAKADNGSSYTMQVILIAVLGGVDPQGGKGNIPGVVLAIVIVQMISTWLSMMETINTFYRMIIWGGLLLAVLIYNYVNNKLSIKRAMRAKEV